MLLNFCPLQLGSAIHVWVNIVAFYNYRFLLTVKIKEAPYSILERLKSEVHRAKKNTGLLSRA
jgi:hypothetical protein